MQQRTLFTSTLSLLAPVVLMVSCDQPDEPTTAGESVSVSAKTELESTIWDGVAPDPAIRDAVVAYQRRDPAAVFTWFNGQVDGFTTRPKDTIPAYARPTLDGLGLSTVARTPRLLSPPVNSADHPNVGRNIDALGDLDLLDGEELAEQVVDYIDWDRPDDATVALEARAALPILAAFLQENREIFGVSPEELEIALVQTSYRVGAFARYARFKLMYNRDEPIIDGDALVEFDANWNIISISRMIITPNKIAVEPTRDRVGVEQATQIAREWPVEGCDGEALTVASATLGVEPISRRRMWSVELSSEDLGACHHSACHYTVSIDAGTGQVLNVSDLVDHYTDAIIRRWGFTNGDQTAPTQLVNSGVYTRDDRRLEHDFFYMMNDKRCENASLVECDPLAYSTQCADAYVSQHAQAYIRGTIRTSRDWSVYYPNSSSLSFGETNAYHWARWFTIWLKPSLDAMGVLPSSSNNYERVLIIANACEQGGSWYSNSYPVSTENDKGEGGGTIRLQHRNPASSSNSNMACQGGGCYDSTGTLQHEMNHFFLHKYYGVPSTLNCNTNELRYTHEGILGSTIMQAFWHNYYGIGYNPTDTNRLYHSGVLRGRVHVDSGSLMTLSQYSCGSGSVYTLGRVGGQVMWKIFHGKKVTGSTITSIARPSTDTDFNVIAYWAAEKQATSTNKSRSQYAAKVMELLHQMQWPAADRSDYCDLWETHGLDSLIAWQHCT